MASATFRLIAEDNRKDLDRQEALNILDEIGGPQGIADSTLPGVLFVVVYGISGEIQISAISAVGLAVILAGFRLWRGEGMRFVVAGLLGILLAAYIASKTGRAENFFLPGIILNLASALVYLFSILIRWPLIGVILEVGSGKGVSWRRDPKLVSLYSRASYPWVGLFLFRFAVQTAFYLSGAVLALGLVRAAMGLPLFILFLWITWLILKRGGIDFSQFLSAFKRSTDHSEKKHQE